VVNGPHLHGSTVGNAYDELYAFGTVWLPSNVGEHRVEVFCKWNTKIYRRIIKTLQVHAAFVGFVDQRGAIIFLSSSYINIYERDRYIASSSAAFSEFLQFVQICSPPIAAVEMHF